MVVRKRFAGFPVVFALTVQGPIPDESPGARKLIEQFHLLGSWVKTIAIVGLNRSVHGAIIPDRAF